MPEVNTHTKGHLSEKQWKIRKTFIDGYRTGLLTREEFCYLWKTVQMVERQGGEND